MELSHIEVSRSACKYEFSTIFSKYLKAEVHFQLVFFKVCTVLVSPRPRNLYTKASATPEAVPCPLHFLHTAVLAANWYGTVSLQHRCVLRTMEVALFEHFQNDGVLLMTQNRRNSFLCCNFFVA